VNKVRNNFEKPPRNKDWSINQNSLKYRRKNGSRLEKDVENRPPTLELLMETKIFHSIEATQESQ
jgi:hypothetical protein